MQETNRLQQYIIKARALIDANNTSNVRQYNKKQYARI